MRMFYKQTWIYSFITTLDRCHPIHLFSVDVLINASDSQSAKVASKEIILWNTEETNRQNASGEVCRTYVKGILHYNAI